MSVWEVCWKSEALRDLERLDASKARRVLAQVRRVALNPRPRSQGGYGKPLGNKGGLDLVGLCEVKLWGDGIRVIYGLEERCQEDAQAVGRDARRHQILSFA